ncbi:MAG TPA: phytanoyl-CoA dioxygenase family protein [Phenylobacterium sp.]|jgi:ectoine hydroxylase-related dioxygenase (phytanoyl-CoA dioxygenase family)|uniref:phytanoyl-CoA dioxygenase family protein n=1 Tax=Phenylobacterium sp. TaxID=1871053 RepID=UPI002BF3A5DA|nr:phytanoyl-CoA dioxygenase family protein [Phenylobacterium sp.]HXA41166.1 phytanoyl-CoA dioxygenase family protein [Phenylobacterium sp.]
MIRRGRPYLEPRTEPASEETLQLEREGYTILRNLLDDDQVAALRREIGEVFERDPPDERGQRPPEDAAMFRYAMLNRSAAAQAAVAHPRLLSTIEPLLGEDCHVIANTAWRNPAGQPGSHGGQNWHIDAGPHVPLPEGVRWPAEIPHPVFALGVHIYLRDCALEDGPTAVIPGSHLSGRPPPPGRHLDDDLEFEGRGVRPFIVRAGDAGLFVSDIWHRRMPTQPGDHGRFFLQVHYGRRDIAQRILTTAQSNQLSPEAIARAGTERERRVIGLHPPFFYDG